MKESVQKIGNFIAIILLGLTVLAGFFIEFILGQTPCILCFLQRAALFGMAVSLYCNLAFGVRVKQYAWAYFWAIFGLLCSLRYLALNLCKEPDSPPFFVFSYRMYTWALLVFLVSLVGLSGLLLFSEDAQKEPSIRLKRYALGFLLVLLSIGTVSVLQKKGLHF